MTSKTVAQDGSQIKKMPGWFSWRHRTRDEHDRAREQYIATHATARARIARKERRKNV
jgi:hypothetical protein